jgi:signal transduction histidine kinase
MAVRGFADAFAVQRLVWLLVGTVIVPTGLLALYGVVAIRNERVAYEDRARRQIEARLQYAAAAVLAEVERVDAAVHRAADACPPEPPCAFLVPGATDTRSWSTASGPPPDLLAAGAPRTAGPQTWWFTPADAGAPIGVFTAGAQSFAWRLDTEALQSFLVGLDRAFLDAGQVVLERQEGGPAVPFDEVLARVEASSRSPRLALDRPLAAWSLTVRWRDGQPPESHALTGVYVAGLIVLVALVIVGALITLSSTARELRLSRLQTDFVSHLGHELRTPMTSIRMFVETLQSGRLRDPERVQECLDLLAVESDRLSRRIERVLEWGRMEAGRRIYEREHTTARQLVDGALAAFHSQTLFNPDETTLDVEVPADTPTLHVDVDAVTEALLNLLQNAARHTEAPRVVRVRAENVGRGVAISVEDNGPGIPAHERNRIFEKFYQSGALLSRKPEGSGLGLAIVRAIAHGHGGRVELWSEVGRGSRFTLWLPAAPP